MIDQDDNLELDDEFLTDDLDDELSLEDFDDDFLDDESGWDDISADEVSDADGAQSQKSSSSQGLQKKGFSLNFNTIVIAGAVVVGLGVFAMQVMGDKNKQAPQQQRFVSSLGVESAAETIAEQDIKEAEKAVQGQGGFLNEGMEVLPDVTYEQDQYEELPMPTPVSDTYNEGRESIAESLEFLTETQSHVIDDAIVSLEEPSISEAEMPVVKKEEGVVDQPVLREPEPVTETVEVKEAVKVEALESADPLQTVENVSSSPSFSSSPLAGIDKKMDVIIERIEGLEDKVDTIEEVGNQRAAIIEDTVQGLEAKIASLKKPVRASTSLQKKAKTTSSRKTAVQKVVWQLKAAQPGKAWISKKGQSSIRPITVGDTVEGIGKISSIRQVNGRWTIEGTTAKIRQ